MRDLTLDYVEQVCASSPHEERQEIWYSGGGAIAHLAACLYAAGMPRLRWSPRRASGCDKQNGISSSRVKEAIRPHPRQRSDDPG